jgi:hypothetical protein
MKPLLLLLALPVAAHASWFEYEAGIGMAQYETEDGRWWQQDVSHSLRSRAPAFSAGLTGPVIQRGAWGLDWHADYVYLGRAAASCVCVSDANYDPVAHKVLKDADKGAFTGSGHMSGVVLSLEPYAWRWGLRWGAEVGAYVYRDTWSDNVITPAFQVQVRSDNAWRVAPVVGASVGDGKWSVNYRHYFTGLNSRQMNVPPLWNDADVIEIKRRF